MQSLSPKFIDSLNFTSSHLADLRKLGEFRGRQDLFSKKSEEALKVLKQHAIIESVESSNRLEQITAPYQRIKGLVNKSTAPKNRSEKEISGYRDALNLIHESYEYMELSVNVIKQLHTIIYRHLPEDGGRFKLADNKIVERDPDGNVIRERFTPVPALQTPQAMESLCQNYMDFLNNYNTDPLILLPLLILDFLCIHPFKDGNGRISRLLTLLVLHRHGYEVGKYISLERIFEESKEGYYRTLHKSSQGWHESKHDPFPWMEYFWGVVIKAYKEFEERVVYIKDTIGGKGSKAEQIKFAIGKKIGPFSISDIEKDCPGISRDMVRHVLRQLRDEGAIQSQGIGRSAKWQVNPLVTIKTYSSGKTIKRVNLLLLFPNKTWKEAVTDKNGEAKIYLHSTKKPMTIFAAAENYSAYLKKDWALLEGVLTIELQKLLNGGSVIFPNSTGYIPGLEGRLNPILDNLNRTYLYADNIAINGGKQQPVYFTFGEKLHLQDSNGKEKIVYIIDIRGKSALLEYSNVSEIKQKV
ncbi:MAG: hypothetical protein F4X95_02720 [Oligoflexia bacterium]|nr:hypothetical protein [Oligoflexia bacterium]